MLLLSNLLSMESGRLVHLKQNEINKDVKPNGQLQKNKILQNTRAYIVINDGKMDADIITCTHVPFSSNET